MSQLVQGLVSFFAALLAFVALVPNDEARAQAAFVAAVLIGLLVGLR